MAWPIATQSFDTHSIMILTRKTPSTPAPPKGDLQLCRPERSVRLVPRLDSECRHFLTSSGRKVALQRDSPPPPGCCGGSPSLISVVQLTTVRSFSQAVKSGLEIVIDRIAAATCAAADRLRNLAFRRSRVSQGRRCLAKL